MTWEGYVLLGDVISSKKIKNRVEFQKKLIIACNAINKAYKDDISANMKIIKGSDEIGCILGKLAPLYEIINRLSNDLYPVKIRFVMVSGKTIRVTRLRIFHRWMTLHSTRPLK